MSQAERVDAYLVAGGKYHDIDFARLELLELLAEHPQLRVTVGADYRDTEAVEPCAPGHALVAGIRPFETDDELYLCEYHDREQLVPLLDTHYRGDAKGFLESDWSHADRHLVSYLRPLGAGAVLYNTLGHCRGHWDMRPVMDYYPRVERCSWELPQYHELLRRGIRWAVGEIG